jgi:hypothetical protein
LVFTIKFIYLFVMFYLNFNLLVLYLHQNRKMKSLAFDDNRINKNNYEIFSIKNMSELR